MLQAFFTDFAIPEKGSSGTQEPVIMEGLHDRHIGFTARRVDRWRDHDPGVMDMDDIWLLRAQQLSEGISRVGIPHRLLQKHQPLDARIGVHLEITSTVEHDLVSRALQELSLLFEDDVFPPRLVVLTVN